MKTRTIVAMALGPLVFLAVFFYYPVLMILKLGLWNGSPTLSYVKGILENPYHRHVIAFTLEQAAASTALTLALGIPGAYVFAKYDFPGKRILKAFVTVPFVMPSIMVALGFLLLFGRNGLFESVFGTNFGVLYSWKAIILANTFYNFPVVVRMVSALWQRINPHYEEAARTLGARGWRLFFRVTLPMLSPAIFASAMLTFVFCYLSFAIPLILGGYRYATMEVDIFTSIVTLMDFRTGAAIAVIQMAISAFLMYFYVRSLYAYSRMEEQRVLQKPKRLHLGLNIESLLLVLYSVIIFVLIALPMLAVVYYSLRAGGSFSLEWYRRVFSPAYNPFFGSTVVRSIENSLTFGFLTVVLSLLVALPLSYVIHRAKFRGKGVLDVLAMLPIASSPVTLAMGYIKAFSATPIYMTVWIVAVAHTIIAYPFVFRSLDTSLRKIKESLREAAMSLGAGELRTFLKVELPLAAGGIIVGAIFAFAMSIAELGATYMLAPPNWQTMTIAIYGFLGERQFGAAAALSTVLMAIAMVAFIGIERLGEEAF
ncbi:MAG: iron ABC transporter permease [Thermococci archaeon]|nr:iron ABC transporter permease [Thermococci archaeon]